MTLIFLLVAVFLKSTVGGQSNADFLETGTDFPVPGDSKYHDWFHRAKPVCGTRAYDHTSRNGRLENIPHDKSLVNRIVGGNGARPDEIPWQASVKLVGDNGQFMHWCGAAIISEYWLLSAAHCFHGRLNRKWWIIVGESHLHREDAWEQMFEVDTIYMHEHYNDTSFDYDFALIKIKPSASYRAIRFNSYAQPVCLPDSTMSLTLGAKLVVSGWGLIKPCEYCQTTPNENSEFLRKAVVPYIGQSYCKLFYPQSITDRMFCAGYTKGGIDSCHGDSGGPVVYKTRGSWVLYGIVSWGEGCAQPYKPGVYGRVSSVLSWISSITWRNSLNSL
ncbi:hypothetical protein BsWGS_19414 [Bradybaena similaris]